QAGDDGGSPRVEEHENDQNGQQAADDERLLDVGDRLANHRRAGTDELKGVPAGSSFLRTAASLPPASATPTALAPVCLRASSATAGAPSTKASDRTSSTPSATSATSPSTIGRPPRVATPVCRRSPTVRARP